MPTGLGLAEKNFNGAGAPTPVDNPETDFVRQAYDLGVQGLSWGEVVQALQITGPASQDDADYYGLMQAWARGKNGDPLDAPLSEDELNRQDYE